jgi:hypothetical protein
MFMGKGVGRVAIEGDKIKQLLNQLCPQINKIYGKYTIRYKPILKGMAYNISFKPNGMSYEMKLDYLNILHTDIMLPLEEEIMATSEFKSFQNYLFDNQCYEWFTFLDCVINQIRLLNDTENTINKFIDYLNEKIEYYGIFYIDGLNLDVEELPFIDGIRFQRVTEINDYTGILDNASYIKTMVKLSGSTTQEINKKIQTLITALTFLKLEPINIVHRTLTNDSIFRKPQISYNPKTILGSNNVTLNFNELEKLKDIYCTLKSPSANNDSIKISLARYHDSLYQPIGVEAKIAFAIESLEALITKDENELCFKLCIRSSQILKVFNYLPESKIKDRVYNKLKFAYDLRSKYIHGSEHSYKKEINISKIYKEILDIVSYTIILFIRVLSKKSKSDLLKIIDLSLISESDVQGLRNLPATFSQ